MKITLALQGNTLTYENDAVSDMSEMGNAFGDGEDDNAFCCARTWQDFIGRAFHLIQQTGGLLTLNGQQISAAKFEDTCGSSVTIDSKVVLEDGTRITLSQLVK